ncbi:MAG: hypothetical protein HUU20_21045 [Pirellulales bacterium]|nr:hypothetical protein [Pirellulales bacterium]
MTQFAVVQDVYELEDWQSAARILTDVLGLHPTAAKQRARRSRGFLAEKLDFEQARRFHQTCESRGLVVHIVEDKDLIVLPKPSRVHELWLQDDALWVRRTQLGPRESIRWERIVLVAAFRTTKREAYHHWFTVGGGLQMDTGPQLKVSKYSKEYAEYLADVFEWMPSGSPARLRLGSREVNYSQALGSDLPDPHVAIDARSDSFRLLLARIHARARNAFVPPETLVLLGAEPDKGRRLHELPGLDDFDAYNRWLLQKLRVVAKLPGNQS